MSATSREPVRLTVGTDDPEFGRGLDLLQRDLVCHPQLHVRRDAVVMNVIESGAKGPAGEVALLVTTSVSGLSIMARVLNEWIRAKARRTLKVTIGSDSIELSGARSKDLERTLGSFLDLHAPQVLGEDPNSLDID
jgi:membrane-associated two-gene conflict system component 1 (EACC1)